MTRRALSLIELLMAIFILGIGIISIAALFPAGIAQQQRSVDDVTGPIVADNALELLRLRLADTDFEKVFAAPWYTTETDFPWSRPAYFLEDSEVDTVNGEVAVPAGSISIFPLVPGALTSGDVTDDGSYDVGIDIPWDGFTVGAAPPNPPVIIRAGERAYPMHTLTAPIETQRGPQYFWECMFRRFQGRVYVAIFVYRAIRAPGDPSPYRVAGNPSNPDVPPLPIVLDLDDGANANFTGGPWDVFTGSADNPVIGTAGGVAYDAGDDRQAWQAPGQWILDQNNNVHRVLGQYRESDGDPVEIELVRPVEPVIPLNTYRFPASAADTDGDGIPEENIVSPIWYLPITDAAGRTLVPVYLVVEEL